MKYTLYMLFAVSGLMHAAAEQPISKNTVCKECIARETAQLPLQVEQTKLEPAKRPTQRYFSSQAEAYGALVFETVYGSGTD
jgi:hypothetical protein